MEPTGFEPVTNCMQRSRSSNWSYDPIFFCLNYILGVYLIKGAGQLFQYSIPPRDVVRNLVYIFNTVLAIV